MARLKKLYLLMKKSEKVAYYVFNLLLKVAFKLLHTTLLITGKILFANSSKIVENEKRNDFEKKCNFTSEKTRGERFL